MKTINFCFRVNQRFNLKRYRFFEIGTDHYYYDDFANETSVRNMSDACYLEANRMFLDMINKSHESYGSQFYPGRLREIGLGVSYQRMLWKGLFATVEVLPLLKTYVDEDRRRIGNGFKLYTSYHIGYHFSFFKNRFFIEPQIHFQNWFIDTNTPQAFKDIDNRWKNYFLLEPNLYFGVKF